jgi:hypothetical protein
MGLMFVSARGLELLTRGLELKWLGDRIQNTIATYPICTGAFIDNFARVRFMLSADESDALQHVSGNSGVVVVYDMSADSFSVAIPYLGGDGVAMQSGCKYLHDTTERVAFCNAQDYQVYESTTSHKDYITYRKSRLTTGWLKLGMHQRQRIYDVYVLMKQNADSKSAVKLSLSYDYDDTVVQTATFEPSTFTGDVVNLNINPSRQTAFAVKLTVEDQTPADDVTYPVGNGQGLDLLGISFVVGPKPGPNPLPASSKG